jgi:hypothetical protein
MYLKGQIGPPHIQQESTFWRRQLWDAAGGCLDTTLRYAGDMELWARFFRIAVLYGVDALIGGIRSHPAQKTAKRASDGSGYYDYADYNAEAEVIIGREVEFFNNSPDKKVLNPPCSPVAIADAVMKFHDSIRAENFSCFTYSKKYHTAYFFDNAEPDAAGAAIDGYRYNLTAAFAMSNLPEGSKILFAGGGFSPGTFVDLTGKYEESGHSAKGCRRTTLTWRL